MHFFVIVTNDCGRKCMYCRGKECFTQVPGLKIEDNIPAETSYSITELKKFIEKDPKPTIILYGGEPLLRIQKVKGIIDNIKARFMLQTNGLHLKELGEEHVQRLHNVMLSIDGEKITTDENRGKGVYDAVIQDVKWLREIGFCGEILARMTVTREMDVEKEARHLLRFFDSVHWQLDAEFADDYNKKRFKAWAEEYNKQVRSLVRFWLENMEQGKILQIYPFVGIMQSLLKEEDSLLRCGAGWAHYAILTNGNIAPCPVMGGIVDYYSGNIYNSHPLKLKKIPITGACTHCDIFELCGGRCLFANKTGIWPDAGHKQVCGTIRNLIESLQKILPEVKKLGLSARDFEYDKFNSCEIIP